MKNKQTLILFFSAFLLGIAFSTAGFLVIKKNAPLIEKISKKLEERRIANLPKAKEPMTLIDFVDPSDIMKFDFTNAKMEASSEHATSGKYSAKIYFQPSSTASAVKIEKYFQKDKSKTNWSGYEVLSFDIFNPYNNTERIILQIKDAKDERAKISLQLQPNTNNHIEVDISRLWKNIKATNISQFNLFLWENNREKIFYLDNLKLLPLSALEKQEKNILSPEFLPRLGEKIYPTGDYFAFNKTKWLKTDSQTNNTFVGIPLVASNYSSANLKNFYFSGGIPFGLGELKSLANLELTDSAGNAVHFQTGVMSRWPDKSIKWALLDLNSDIAARGQKEFILKYADAIKTPQVNSSLSIKDTPEKITVNTGKLQFSINKNNFYLFDNVWLDKNKDARFDDSELITSKADLVLLHNEREYYSHLDRHPIISIEEQGPLKVVLRAQGWFVSEKGDKFCQTIVRISAFEGSSYLKVQPTVIYTGYPENKVHYLYQGRRLPKNETIDSWYIKMPVKIGENSKFTFAGDNKIMQGDFLRIVEFQQSKDNVYSLSEENKIITTGNKLEGWLDLSSAEAGITLGVKNFWQQFPKGFNLDKNEQCISLYLWPKAAGKLDLKTTEDAGGTEAAGRGSAFGLAKSHELFFYFHEGDYENSDAKDMAAALTSDVLVSAAPEWVADSRVLGKIRPYDKRLDQAEDFLSRLFDWGNRQIDNFKWYGMIDFGDTLSWYRDADDDNSYEKWGWHPVGRWGWFNCEAAGTHTGALIQFLRNADYKYFKFGANLARHIMDIDTCHYNTVANDPRLKRVIPDDYSQVGSMHRHNANHWGGRNEESAHTNVLGLVLYYYITGDGRAREVIDEIGQFFLSEKVAYYGHPDVAPQRSIANVLWGDVLLYEITQDPRYKKAADKLANLFYQGQKYNGSWSENYNPVKKRWDGEPDMGFIEGYTLPALISYHQLTSNKAIAGCIIKATDFVIKNEEYAAYFDASAYSYWLTGNKKYSENIKKKLSYILDHQIKNDNPIWNGMVYQKAYYYRVVESLYKMPFVFEIMATEE